MSPRPLAASRGALLLLLLLLALLLAACGGPRERSRARNLVLVVLDTVRADHLSAYGYGRPTSPALERLAAQGTLFERAYSTSAWTLPAHASMFTGLPPERHRATQSHLHLARGLQTVAQELAAAGYQCAGFSNNPWVSERTGLAAGFEPFEGLWGASGRWAWLLGHPTVRRVARWFRRERDPERPFFLFVNLMEAHGPYTPDWEHAEPLYGGDREAFERDRELYATVADTGFVRAVLLRDPRVTPELVAAAARLYDAELRAADDAMGQVLELVDRYADPATTTVLVVSDHGENLGEHGLAGHAFALDEPLVRVALVARGPGFEPGTRRDDPVQLLDVRDTLLAAAGLDAPSRGLFERSPPDRGLRLSYAYPRQVLSTFTSEQQRDPDLRPYRRSLRAAIWRRWKLVRGSDGSEELYDLAVDPAEEHPLPLESAQPELLQRLGELAGEPARRHPARRFAPSWSLDETRALRQLGYLE